MSKYIISLLAMLIFVEYPAIAQGNFNKIGKIKSVVTSSPDNGAFRVYLDINLPECMHNFAFIDANHGNYQATVANGLTAYSMGAQVNLLLVQVPKSGGSWCQIIDITQSR